MRLLCIVLGALLTATVSAANRLIFSNTTQTPDASIQLAPAQNFDVNLTGEGGAGSLVVTADDDDLACGGTGLGASPGVGLARIEIDLPTLASLVYYVEADFSYDGGANDLTVEPVRSATFDISCFSSLIFSDGFQD